MNKPMNNQELITVFEERIKAIKKRNKSKKFKKLNPNFWGFKIIKSNNLNKNGNP